VGTTSTCGTDESFVSCSALGGFGPMAKMLTAAGNELLRKDVPARRMPFGAHSSVLVGRCYGLRVLFAWSQR
jgi:hypothetical protein